MGKAYVCDWCGEFFKPQLDTGEFFVSIPEFTAKLGGDPLSQSTQFEEAHFCPKCSVKFMKIIFGEEAERVIMTEILRSGKAVDSDPCGSKFQPGMRTITSVRWPFGPLD